MEKEPRINIDVNHIFNEQTQTDHYGQIEQHPIYKSEQPSLHMNLISIDLDESREQVKSYIAQQRKKKSQEVKVTAEGQLMNLAKLIIEKEKTIKKLNRADTSLITEKLFHQKSSVCSKSQKKKTSNIHSACKQSLKIPDKQQSNVVRVAKSGSKSKMSDSDVHERLYNMSKSQFLKQMYISQPQEKLQIKKHRKSVSSIASSRYLKNYTTFEKRLQEYALHRPQLNTSQSMLLNKEFKPQLIPNKYNERVQSRYRQSQIREAKPSDYADFMNSSVSSSNVSATNRSAMITQKVEQHFLQKMQLIFVKNPNSIIEIDESIVGLLTELQFGILQPFIMRIEEQRIIGEQFQSKFRQFYESITASERIELRNHEVKNKCKYRQLKDQIKKRKSPKKQLTKVLQKPYKKTNHNPTTKRQSNGNTNYHSVIQNYI